MSGADAVVMATWFATPLASLYIGRRWPAFGTEWKRTRRGVVMGVVALPLSMALYSLFYLVPVLGIIPGLPGLLLLMWHLAPFGGAFQELYGAALGIRPEGSSAFSLWAPTVFWGIIYGSVGAFLDVRRRRVRGGASLKRDAG